MKMSFASIIPGKAMMRSVALVLMAVGATACTTTNNTYNTVGGGLANPEGYAPITVEPKPRVSVQPRVIVQQPVYPGRRVDPRSRMVSSGGAKLGYSVHVGSFLSLKGAKKQISKLAAHGVDAYHQTVMIDGIRYIRVMAGRYKTVTAAKQAALNLRRNLRLKGKVVPLK